MDKSENEYLDKWKLYYPMMDSVPSLKYEYEPMLVSTKKEHTEKDIANDALIDKYIEKRFEILFRRRLREFVSKVDDYIRYEKTKKLKSNVNVTLEFV